MSKSRHEHVRTWAVRLERGAVLADQGFGWGQLIYAASGVVRVTAAGSQWVLPPGRALWSPPGVRHQLRCVSAIELRALYFRPPWLPELPDRCTVLGVPPLLRELLIRFAQSAPKAPEDTRSQRLLAVLHDELAVAPHLPTELTMPRDPAALRLALLLLDNPGSPLALDAWCRRAGASRRTLERCFRAETHASLGAWRRVARMQHALLLLGQGRSVDEVAEAVGYERSSAFVAAFRREMGETPGRARRRALAPDRDPSKL